MMFVYEVRYLSDICDEEVKIAAGVISASSVSDAAKFIEDYYDVLLISVNLTYLDYASRNTALLDCVKDHFNLSKMANS